MKRREQKYGKSMLRWLPSSGGGFDGVVIRDGKIALRLHHADEDQLVAALRNAAGTLEPGYFGFDSAIARFQRFVPAGFADASNPERKYKLAAAESLSGALSPQAALEAVPEVAVRVAQAKIWIGMLSVFESQRLKEVLLGPNGANYLVGAAMFVNGEYSEGIARMEAAVRPHGRISWPLLTYLPFLWDINQHMLLKPEVTCDFSERVGLDFHHRYSAEPDTAVYLALLQLVAETRARLATLHPADNIDVQSFIWVVGKYTEAELPA